MGYRLCTRACLLLSLSSVALSARPAGSSQLPAQSAFPDASFQTPSPTTSQPPPTPAAQTAPPVSLSGAVANTVVITPENAEATGDALMVHQRYQAALAAYKVAPQRTAEVWNKMGIAYQLMFNLEEASHCYQASLRLDAKNSRVINNLGTIYDSEKQYGSAERMYHRALKLDNRSALIYKNLGTNLLAQHKYKKGWEVYKTALQIDPHIFQHNDSPRIENPSSVQERGAMNYYMAKGCVRAGMNDSAIDYLRMALNEGFTNPKKIQADVEFAALRGLPAFKQLLAEQTKQPEQTKQ
jgi:tetratricopeptide (TPR) repeat protein